MVQQKLQQSTYGILKKKTMMIKVILTHFINSLYPRMSIAFAFRHHRPSSTLSAIGATSGSSCLPRRTRDLTFAHFCMDFLTFARGGGRTDFLTFVRIFSLLPQKVSNSGRFHFLTFVSIFSHLRS